MKLLICLECQDVFKLSTKRVRKCACGKTRGKYKNDGLHAWYSGPCMPLGFANLTLAAAIQKMQQDPDADWGKYFKAFVIPPNSDTCQRRTGKGEKTGSDTRGQRDNGQRTPRESNGNDGRADSTPEEEAVVDRVLDKFRVTGNLQDCPSVMCNKCGWVHFAVTYDYAVKQVAEFNEWYNKQPQMTKDCYGGPAKLSGYCFCGRCGNTYKDFRAAKAEECPNGSTINPILHFSEETLGKVTAEDAIMVLTDNTFG